MPAIRSLAVLLGFVLVGAGAAEAGVPDPLPERYPPDPASVQRYGPAYRYPQAGWTVLHIEGAPYDRGYQHGRLMSTEIADFVKSLAVYRSPSAPSEGWRDERLLVNALFLRKYDPEYLEEMKGIADGAAAAGAKFEGRAVDLLDIVTANSDIEVAFLDNALDSTANGLEGKRFKEPAEARPKRPAADHCSAFVATGPATKDGKVVIGHITMWGLYHVRFYNVWLDVKPEKGHRVIMQTYPGGIMSGLDYYMNDHGLVVAETTIAQTRFDINGAPLAGRIRRALQYSDTIDDAVKILKTANNGLYTNEWLLADTNTNEIAMFELGTHKSKLWRSGDNDWYGGTPGFYWGCNNPKDLDVRLETVPGVEGRPANMVFHPSERDRTWLSLYEKWKGKIDVNFGFEAFTTPPLAAFPSCDAKFTTSDMTKRLESYALFGPPLGRVWDPTPGEKERYSSIRPLVPNDWTLLSVEAPNSSDAKAAKAVDIAGDPDAAGDLDADGVLPPAWRGTILPATDADLWLAAAFANYERIVAHRKVAEAKTSLEVDTPAAKIAEGKIHADESLVDAAKQVCQCERVLRDVAQTLRSTTKPDPTLASAKKKLSTALASFKSKLDKETYADHLALLMFGPRSDYLSAVRRLGRDLALAEIKPILSSDEWYQIASGKGVLLLAEMRRTMGAAKFDEYMDEFGRAHAGKPASTEAFFQGAEKAHGKPLSAIREVYRNPGSPTSDNGEGCWSIVSFELEPERALIVYGTLNESSAQREGATLLQRQIERRWRNQTIPIKADVDVKPADLKGRHLLLVGRPSTNKIAAELASGLPLKFDRGSFVLRDKTYAHPSTAVIAAGQHPRDPRYSIVVFAGLAADATWRVSQELGGRGGTSAPVVLFEAGGRVRRMTVPVPAKETDPFGQSVSIGQP
jgi:Phospholipase B